MKVITIVGKNSLRQNTYLVENGNSAILIDCGASLKDIEKEYKKETGKSNLPQISAILLTHTHFDHTCFLKEIQPTKNIPVYTIKNGSSLISSPYHNASQMLGNPLDFKPTNIIEIKDETPLSIGDIKVTPYFTPGHTSCSISYLIEDFLFTGDTLFYLAVGRTDLPSGNADDLNKSLKKIKNIPWTLCYPGHGIPFN